MKTKEKQPIEIIQKEVLFKKKKKKTFNWKTSDMCMDSSFSSRVSLTIRFLSSGRRRTYSAYMCGVIAVHTLVNPVVCGIIFIRAHKNWKGVKNAVVNEMYENSYEMT